LDPKHFLTPEEEKKRYSYHQNDENDSGYREFLKPLFDLLRPALRPGMEGLDFGAGKSSALARLFEEEGFSVTRFDPYFFPDQKALARTYDFVFTSEVVEHFFFPRREWDLLHRLLCPQGVLGVMTSLYDPSKMDFEDWYYRKYPTHVSFYGESTLRWIQRHYGFSDLQILPPRTCCFQK